jgi:hypothetical protein
VVAEHGRRAIGDQLHDRLDRPFRIGAVADVVPQQHDALGASRARVGETGGKSLPVGMNVGEERDQHGAPESLRRSWAAALTFVKCGRW